MRLKVAILALACFTIATVVAPGSAAQADPTTAMNYCKLGAGGFYSSAALDFYTGPPYFAGTPTLHPGDVYKVVYRSGTINDGGWPTSTNWSPDGAGWGHVAPSGGSWPAPGLPKYGLIAGWNGLPGYYWLGAQSLCVQWTGTTDNYAYFWMNDEFAGDNHGYWELTVHSVASIDLLVHAGETLILQAIELRDDRVGGEVGLRFGADVAPGDGALVKLGFP